MNIKPELNLDALKNKIREEEVRFEEKYSKGNGFFKRAYELASNFNGDFEDYIETFDDENLDSFLMERSIEDYISNRIDRNKTIETYFDKDDLFYNKNRNEYILPKEQDDTIYDVEYNGMKRAVELIKDCCLELKEELENGNFESRRYVVCFVDKEISTCQQFHDLSTAMSAAKRLAEHAKETNSQFDYEIIDTKELNSVVKPELFKLFLDSLGEKYEEQIKKLYECKSNVWQLRAEIYKRFQGEKDWIKSAEEDTITLI